MTAEDFLKDPEWININMRCIEINMLRKRTIKNT